MISRASGPLAIAYLLIFASGIFFLVSPSLVLDRATDYNQLVLIWGLFYLVGGAVSLLALLSRGVLRSSVALWYFEISGIALTVTANIVYAYALAQAGIFYHESNVLALALILTAFSAGLIARCIETLRLVKILNIARRRLED